MKLVIQRVRHASCTIDGEIYSKIGNGFMVLVGLTYGDDEMIVSKMASKLVKLRVFDDENGKMNLALKDVGGSILSISQFTLFADAKKGNRPSFTSALKPEFSKPLYLLFNEELRKEGIDVQEGIFGADMKIDLLNDGPITIILDSKELF